MKKVYEYEYPHPAVATDSVVFGFDGKELLLLLIERSSDVYNGCWALPGGFMRIDESVEECAMRELREETGVRDIYLEQFHVFSKPDRDSRERVLSVAFVALVRKSDYRLIASDDAARASWFSADELPPLAFDHEDIVRMARLHLRKMLRESPIVFKLLDEKFSIAEVQRLYELINGVTYDRRNFARKITSSGLLLDQGVSPVPSHNRFPNLYSFDEKGYEDMMAESDGGAPAGDDVMAEDCVMADMEPSEVVLENRKTPSTASAPEPAANYNASYYSYASPAPRKYDRKQTRFEGAPMADEWPWRSKGQKKADYKKEKFAAKEEARVLKKKKSRNPFDI